MDTNRKKQSGGKLAVLLIFAILAVMAALALALRSLRGSSSCEGCTGDCGSCGDACSTPKVELSPAQEERLRLMRARLDSEG